MDKFIPSDNWQEVPEDAICPPGLEYRLGMEEGGKKYARLPQVKDSNLELALQLAGRGWHVFPCREKPGQPYTDRSGKVKNFETKAPYYDKSTLPNGKDNATTDPETIRRWWKRWPGALVGIYCEKSGLFALDVDCKDGKNGDATLHQLIITKGKGQLIINGPMQTTPSGGYHVLFKLPTTIKIPNNAEKLAEGLDLRSNGYICTGSLPDGSGYQWIPDHGPDTPLTEAPAWLLEMIRDMKANQKPASKAATTPADPWQSVEEPQLQRSPAAWVAHYLTFAVPGNRNETGFQLALQLRDAGLSESEAEQYMLDYARRAPGQGYTEGEALASLQSAYKGIRRDPAAVLSLNNGSYTSTISAQKSNGQPANKQPQAKILRTELGNSRRFSRTYKDRALHVESWGWLFWNGQRWEADQTGQAVTLAKKIIDQLYEETFSALGQAEKAAAETQKACSEEEWKSKREEFQKAIDDAKSALVWALKSQTAQKIQAMISLAESDLPALVDDFDADPWLLNCENGVLDLKTGELLAHDPARRITKIAGTQYDPAAQCPLWLDCLRTWFNDDQEKISFMQRAIGYTLTGSTAEQVIFFLFGVGKNGKSVFSEVLQALLGEYSRKTPTDTLMAKYSGEGIPNDIARLPGARAVIAAELAEGKRLNESLIKDLTGGDRMVARYLRREFFEFNPSFKIWMYGNHKPDIRGTDDGIWRRLKLIDFTVIIPEAKRDPNLIEKLKGELPGILAWAVRGCLDWQKTGLRPPASVEDSTQQYRDDQDLLGAFLADCTVKKPLCSVTHTDLYDAYKAYMIDNGEAPKGPKKFGNAMKERGFIADPKNRDPKTGRTLYLGIGLLAKESEAK